MEGIAKEDSQEVAKNNFMVREDITIVEEHIEEEDYNLEEGIILREVPDLEEDIVLEGDIGLVEAFDQEVALEEHPSHLVVASISIKVRVSIMVVSSLHLEPGHK